MLLKLNQFHFHRKHKVIFDLGACEEISCNSKASTHTFISNYHLSFKQSRIHFQILIFLLFLFRFVFSSNQIKCQTSCLKHVNHVSHKITPMTMTTTHARIIDILLYAVTSPTSRCHIFSRTFYTRIVKMLMLKLYFCIGKSFFPQFVHNFSIFS